ncbi:PREDICTED: uncharacterized protein LOC108764289 [Trachymyrmex cornetzi]|uniref:uncharacterized protein LOC108764289 n=1 Tax=Trachymyrmex cornetzi TaxID=471704 RepID=UPI00084F14E1|nr:PREDICTED: uncharacterized protein LOC108764289 [Trachymyrmex cornetzi]
MTTDAQVLHSSIEHITYSPNVLLATALIKKISPSGETCSVRALLDQGSEISLVTERLVQRQHLPRTQAHLTLTGIGAQKSSRTKGLASVTLKPHFASDYELTISVYILKRLTSSIPSVAANSHSWKHLNDLKLADLNYYSPGSIDMILGADVYSQIIEEGIIKGQRDSPIAQRTKFGWIVSGPVKDTITTRTARGFHVTLDEDLPNLLRKFWALEEPPSTRVSRLSLADQDCEDHFKSTYSRDEQGRYIVKLPFKESIDKLGESHNRALRLAMKLRNRLDNNEDYARAYSDFLKEYERLQHMRLVPVCLSPPSYSCYLPHHGVMREQSLTTKLRVVFNGSSPTSSGYSLNDLLHTGEKLQTELFDILIWFRLFRYVFCTDVEKMFRQIKVHPDHWAFQRILWMDPDKRLSTYELTTKTSLKYPLAVPVLKKGRYVDDVFGGADCIERTQEIINQLIPLCKAGGFNLQKWTSNHPKILEHVPMENQVNHSTVHIENDLIVHTLGLEWQPSKDVFQFTSTLFKADIVTKRTILSTIARIYDPLGLLSPIIITAKIIIQELWSIKLGWDDPLPNPIANKWCNFLNKLQNLSKLTFPRWIGWKVGYLTELHGFCDASQLAMAAVVYIRITNVQEETTTILLASKTKVAPLKRLTIPRLELTGAFLLTKVCYIQETLPQATWKFIPGNENLADLATRGLTPNQLSEQPAWWTGPSWLSETPSSWPTLSIPTTNKELLEEKPTKINVALVTIKLWDLVLKYSSLNKLVRITALCRRAIAKLRKTATSLTTLTTQELEDARLFWVSAVQKSHFQQELEILSKHNSLPTSNPLLRLTPFVDSKGLLRVGGRLQRSLLPPSEQHPLILPKDSPLTRLIIAEAHQRTLHGGTQVTLSYIRHDYWIIGGRSTVRSFILKCVRCARYRQKRAQQLMGQLPPERITPSRPFTHTGVDYASPFVIKTWKGKNAKTYKAYIALFVCYATSAIHLELVTDYTADRFIAAFKRFTARRGICSTLYSDYGTNFKGADAELQRLFTLATQESNKLATLLSNDGTQWRFNPPSTPHFGGKWEAGVKSVKLHLYRIVGNSLLTYEEFTTLLTQIEAVLNSRPLSALTEDPDDLQALTPGHFLMGCAPSVVPEPCTEHIKLSHLSRWQLIQQMTESFWTRWSKECLQRYYARYKWKKPLPSLTIGDLVLVVDERYPSCKWPIGRIVQTHPGTDGLTRVVSIQTHSSVLKRSVGKVCPLPISHETL